MKGEIEDMKTTIYELLGMIKDNNTPKKILFKEQIYEYTRTGYYDSDNGETLFDTYYIDEILNDEVEILETTITYNPDKIEKVNTYVLCDSDFHTRYKDGYSLKATEIIDKAFEEYSHKINELIDKFNKEVK